MENIQDCPTSKLVDLVTDPDATGSVNENNRVILQMEIVDRIKASQNE